MPVPGSWRFVMETFRNGPTRRADISGLNSLVSPYLNALLHASSNTKPRMRTSTCTTADGSPSPIATSWLLAYSLTHMSTCVASSAVA